MATIALTLITKGDDELTNLHRALSSFLPFVDGLYISINGKETAKTTSYLDDLKKQTGFKVKYEVVNPQLAPELYTDLDGEMKFANFAAARNRSWDLVDQEYDYLLWADSDDVLYNGEQLRLVANTAHEKNIDAVYVPYWYAVKAEYDRNGMAILREYGEDDVVIDHYRERLIRPNKFKWVSRLHEVVMPLDDHYQPKNTNYEYDLKKGQSLVWVHLPGQDQPLENLKRNAAILQIQAKEENYKDPRTIFYLAKTNFDLNTPESNQKCIELLDKYLNASGWAEERANAREYKALVYVRQKKLRQAVDELHEAIKEWPSHHSVYLRLASIYQELGMNHHFRFWLNNTVKMEKPKTNTTIGNPLEIKTMLASLKYNEAFMDQRVDDMVYWATIRKDLMGEDDGIYEYALKTKEQFEANKALFTYAKFLKDTNQNDKLNDLLKSVPAAMQNEPVFHFIANEVKEPVTWSKKSVVIFASFGASHFEQWSDKNIDKGIGGSETAVIKLAEQWLKKGYKVTVFCDCGDDAGIRENGVEYKNWTEMNWHDEFNILILWRSPHLLDKNIKTKKLFMDLHDVQSPTMWDEKRIKKVDKVFFKSQWHRENVPNLPDEKCVVISNGIETYE